LRSQITTLARFGTGTTAAHSIRARSMVQYQHYSPWRLCTTSTTSTGTSMSDKPQNRIWTIVRRNTTWGGVARLNEFLPPRSILPIERSALAARDTLRVRTSHPIAIMTTVTVQAVTIEGTLLAQGIRVIPKRAYEDNHTLIHIRIDGKVQQIQEGAFARCSRLESVRLDHGVQLLEEFCFSGCKTLQAIWTPVSLIAIRSRSFWYCEQLQLVDLPQDSNLQVIEEYAFYNCFCLQRINIPKCVKAIQSNAFYGAKSLREVRIVDGLLEEIGESAFEHCESLESIYIPGSVQRIGVSSFASCKMLQSVILGNGILAIGKNAFQGCKKLTAISIPPSVNKIEFNAFEGCESLATIIFHGKPGKVNQCAFTGCSRVLSIHQTSYKKKFDLKPFLDNG
jgi:hypothetical protein